MNDKAKCILFLPLMNGVSSFLWIGYNMSHRVGAVDVHMLLVEIIVSVGVEVPKESSKVADY